MEETFEQKVIRNVQGNYAVYKTTEVVGSKSLTPNLEWIESDEVDKFFAFARNLGAKVIYIAEGEEEDEQGSIKNNIVQVGFMHQGVMHVINLAEEDDEEETEEEDEYEYDDEEGEENDSQEENVPSAQPQTPPVQQNTGHASQQSQSQQQTNQIPPQQNQNNGFIGGNNF